MTNPLGAFSDKNQKIKVLHVKNKDLKNKLRRNIRGTQRGGQKTFIIKCQVVVSR